MPPALDGRLVRMRGLPFTSTAEDVLEFLRPAEPVGGSHGVVFACTPDGRPTGEAYMEFSKSEDHQHALTRHKELLGTRYIEVFDSTKGELYYIVHQRGFFTSVGGYRMHHPPLPIPGDESNPYPPMSYATRATRRDVMRPSESAAMEAMTKAFSSFGPSRLDRQVPGPRRPPASGGHQRGGEEARYAASAAPAPWAGVMPGPRPPLFNPAPGPSGAGSAAAAAGSRGPGQVGPMPTGGYDYTRQQAVMINPFMMQHPVGLPAPTAGQRMVWWETGRGAPSWHARTRAISPPRVRSRRVLPSRTASQTDAATTSSPHPPAVPACRPTVTAGAW